MVCSDELEYAITPPTPDAAHERVLIFFIPGNPGMVEYYRHFLDIIKKQLTSRDSKHNIGYYIHGASLAGFDVSPGSRQTLGKAQNLPLSLDEQVEDVYRRVERTVDRLRVRDSIEGNLPVILIGHSIGAYMVLQTVNKWQRLAKQGPTSMRLSAGICLFPTIYELNLSPTGRQVGVSSRTACKHHYDLY
jgi:pimeloyl-ACP methyl ester carboxylesterase